MRVGTRRILGPGSRAGGISRANLIAYYTKSDVNDSSGNNRTLTNSGVTFVTGKVGDCGRYAAASSQFLERTDAAFVLSTFTLACQVKLASKPANPMNIIDRHTGTVSGYALFHDNISDRLTLRVGDGANTADAVWSASISTGTWYSVIAWMDDAADQLGISVDDGTPVLSSFAFTVNDSGSPFRLGQYGSGGSFYDGDLDEVLVFGRVLTAVERTYYRAQTSAGLPPLFV